jgi:hypothetical protein
MLLVLLDLWVLICVLREHYWVVGCWVLLVLLKCIATLGYCVRLLDLYAACAAESLGIDVRAERALLGYWVLGAAMLLRCVATC